MYPTVFNVLCTMDKKSYLHVNEKEKIQDIFLLCKMNNRFFFCDTWLISNLIAPGDWSRWLKNINFKLRWPLFKIITLYLASLKRKMQCWFVYSNKGLILLVDVFLYKLRHLQLIQTFKSSHRSNQYFYIKVAE